MMMSSNSSALDEIPKPLTKLIRLILRGFYNIEQKLVIDMLIRRKETSEDDLLQVLKLEKKHLKNLIHQLKQDKFISTRLMMDTDGEGKSTRRSYYSINYRMFVNVVKYKIDHMRRRLETDERDLTSRAGFICQSCNKKFTDLEIDQIYDPRQDQCFCTFCNGIVVEDPNVRPRADSRLVMANFNQQMEPIYALLQETENIKWSIIEADRNNITVTSAQAAGGTSNGAGANSNSAATTNGSLPSDQQNLGLVMNSNIQDQYPVHIEGLDENNRQKEDTKLRFTINPEIEALLLREESLANSSSGTVQESSHDEDDTLNDSTLVINVGQTRVPVSKISDEHVELMTPQQRDDYKKLMQQIYSLIYG